MIAADQLTTLERTLVCNVCHGHLAADGDDLVCARCGRRFQRNRHGYYELMAAHGDVDTAHIDTTTEEYAACQHECAPNLYHSYVKPYLEQVPAKRILDVGCGVGAEVDLLRRDGYEAYGIDLPGLSRFWAREGRDSTYFFGADATRTPFPDDSFDVVYSLGVIEHIGTLTGHCTLGPGYRAQRQRYAHEVLRVVRPGGRVLIACPNKHFPVDIQHGPTDDASGPRPLREFIFQRTGLTCIDRGGRIICSPTPR
jgi:SAM-dependent methyltransferase